MKNEPSLSDAFAVAADGAVMLPILGLAHVAGRPLDELAEEPISGYARSLAEPEAQLAPAEECTAMRLPTRT